MGDYVARIHWRINLKSVEDFVPVDVLEKKIEQLALEGLGEKEQAAIHAFQTAMKRRREGEPDDSLWDNEDD
ncbi:MAG: hypothetical protein HY314_01835 [Acidobacteria bacterium]|nr:hypothetical protein [Acidobacteriota bacterium]